VCRKDELVQESDGLGSVKGASETRSDHTRVEEVGPDPTGDLPAEITQRVFTQFLLIQHVLDGTAPLSGLGRT
jgi:hypothetical protein